jgi:Na+-driven multidrug efflux pump
MLAVASWAFWLFDRSEEVIAIGVAFAQITFPWYFFYAVLEVQADTMRGYGHSLGPALVVLANICILRVAIVFAAGAQGLEMDAIAASYPITWCTTAVCLVVMRVVFVRRRRQNASVCA